ncbi:hypothetical protein N657DRAFT_210059 [Parathielavia appendiculata]|uniref:Uncharacterized protein n=1 Tax=Parathielavia appendiculata TaxID=2587402 RepID=A0AAN6U7R6_9PEZI|nr:hypothetical protein N657DRAFT_210059 [Parathielavia appendiculata]
MNCCSVPKQRASPSATTLSKLLVHWLMAIPPPGSRGNRDLPQMETELLTYTPRESRRPACARVSTLSSLGPCSIARSPPGASIGKNRTLLASLPAGPFIPCSQRHISMISVPRVRPALQRARGRQSDWRPPQPSAKDRPPLQARSPEPYAGQMRGGRGGLQWQVKLGRMAII